LIKKLLALRSVCPRRPGNIVWITLLFDFSPNNLGKAIGTGEEGLAQKTEGFGGPRPTRTGESQFSGETIIPAKIVVFGVACTYRLTILNRFPTTKI